MSKPNVLIIMADQQRYDTIGCMGNSHMKTPNLDKLCQEGRCYTNAHSHTPVCMPARHDLLTGLTARTHGYFANAGGNPIKDDKAPTISGVFSNNGYKTASIGKMHFHPVRIGHGYQEMYAMEEIPQDLKSDDYATYLKENGDGSVQNIHGVRPVIYHTPQNSLVKEENYETRWVENTAINWLDQNGDNPFFLFVGYIKPHPPWDIPKKYQGMYKDVAFPETIEKSREYPEHKGENALYGDLDSKEQIRKNREAYYTACSMVDESVGVIIEHLREIGQIDNTVIIYTSDHGEMLSDKGYYSKDLPYESAVRVPFIVRYPEKFKAAEVNTDFVDLLDIFPTCLDLAGLEYPSEDYTLYGDSLLGNNRDRSIVYASDGFLGPKRWVMARTKKYKYIYKFNQGFEELYDMENDKGEVYNIYQELKGKEEIIQLRKKAVAYESENGPEGSVVNDDFIKVQGEMAAGYEHGKYHLWSNKQFQTFLNQSKPEFGETFVKEYKEALSNKENSGNDKVLDNDFMKDSFQDGFEKLGEYDNILAEIFK